MGLYDYLNGDQVKCFYIPNMYVDVDPLFRTKEKILDIWNIGGNLKGYKNGNRVPYKSLYYYYGKNFIIFNCDHFEGTESIIHIIENGKLLASYDIDEIPNIDISKFNVFDKYGEQLNIKTVEDFLLYQNEKVSSYKEYIERTKDSSKEFAEIMKKYHTEKEDCKKNFQEIEKRLKEIEKISNKAARDCFTPVTNKWVTKISEEDKRASVFGCLLYVLIENFKTEEQKKEIIEYYKKECEKHSLSIDGEIKNYIKWMKQNNNKAITNKKIYELIKD